MNFRAKVKVESVTKTENGETFTMRPVTNGSPEDNSYSKWTPSGMLQLTVTNPNLLNIMEPGDIYYVDFNNV